MEKSTPAAYELPSVPLGRSVHGPVAVEPIANCRFHCLSPLFCKALRRLISRAVEAAMHDFLSSAGYFGRRPASYDDQVVRSAPIRLDALVVLHTLGKRLQGRRRGSFILWSQCSGIQSVRSCPVSWANFPEGDRLTAAEELFRDSGGVQMSCSRLSRSAEFCSAFPQCLHVAPRVSVPWDRSLLLRAQIARAVLDQSFRQRDCVPLFGN